MKEGRYYKGFTGVAVIISVVLFENVIQGQQVSKEQKWLKAADKGWMF